ncbi:MAG: aldehyde ferredoxin oxidoreductase C-terminal domain-containing protein, partial [Chloroflexota bacterium]|nr:aldehyde ferredoxin oxidoreductase C-terminal domain-containing protein [Chloroflexota bacterium]
MTLDGYTGKVLRVDLESGRLSHEELDEALLRQYVGGTGLGAWYLYKEVPPTLDWSDPQNRLIIASGPLGGTSLDGTGSFSVVTKGALTNGAASSQANGFLGAFLKFCGFDAIVIQGTAPRWVYLYIEEGKAELREASHLMGKDTWETEALIRSETGKKERQLSVACIGPAGENLVRFAALVAEKTHVAGHNGIGAVMGSKRLKAVAVARGQRAVTINDRQAFSAQAKELFLKRINDEAVGKRLYLWGPNTLYTISEPTGRLPVKNLTASSWPLAEKFAAPYYRQHWQIKPNPCWACRNHHCYRIKVLEGPYSGYEGEEPEYEIMAALGSNIGLTDPGAAFMLCNEVDRLGMEGIEAGWITSWLMECYEKELITRDEVDGLDLTWGNAEVVKALLHRIARRQGVGDFLAEGMMRSCESKGGAARECGVYTLKGNTPRAFEVRAGMWSEILDEATSNLGFAENAITHVEEFGLAQTDPYSPEEVPFLAAAMKGKTVFMDSLVICFHCTGHFIQPLVELLNAATGWDFTKEEARDVGLRVVNLMRAYNLRAGIGPGVEKPSARLLAAPTSGPAQGKSIASV